MSTSGVNLWGEGSFAGPGGAGAGGGGGSPPAITSFAGSTSSSTPAAAVTLSWTVTGSTSVTIDNGIGPVAASGSVAVSPLVTTTYTLTATNTGGTVTQTFLVTVLGASPENVRYHQIRALDRNGTGKQFQMYSTSGTIAPGYVGIYDAFGNIFASQPRGNSQIPQLADSTAGFTSGNLLAFDGVGNARDSGVAASGVLSIGNLYGAWYGQTLRGTIDGSNRFFSLDYQLANPFTILEINGIVQTPDIQGDPSSLNATTAVVGEDYVVAPSGQLTLGTPLELRDVAYIWYYRGNPATGIVYPAVTSATCTVWTAFRSFDNVPHAFAQANWFPSGTLASKGLSNPHSGIVSLSTLYTIRQDVVTVFDHTDTVTYGTVTPPPLVLDFTGSTVVFQLNGTLVASDPNYIDIYDVYLTFHFADGSTQLLRPVNWAFTSGSGASYSSWQPSHNYAFGDVVVDTNGNLQTCSFAGQSGTSAPIWGSSGITGDGAAQWTYTSAQTSSTGQISNATAAFDPESTIPPATFATFTRTAYAGLATGGTFTVIF